MSLNMVDEKLLQILVCPETKEALILANSNLVNTINEKIQQQLITNRGKRKITEPINGGLLRVDHKFLYPIREDIPIMLIDEAIPVEDLL